MPFCSSILKMSSTEYGTKFQAYTHLKDDALIEGDFATKRGALVRLLKDNLHSIAKKKLHIEYKNYERQMMLKEGVMLVGWPSKFEMRAPSNAGNGGSEMITELLTLVKAGKLYWAKVPEKEREELRVKYENAPPISRKRRRTKGKTSEEDEDEDKDEDEEEDNEEDNEEEEDAPKKKGDPHPSPPPRSPPPSPPPKKAASQAVTKKATSRSRKRKAPELEEEEQAQETDEEPAPKKAAQEGGVQEWEGCHLLHQEDIHRALEEAEVADV
ncbi:hypothetical protein B0H14DRAFT_3433356 [Mycena olivaceomarginata]|nr:hypothetical protein B0H14DRAFT_3433356 [Mycena olivaceomarginata]